MSMDTGLSRRGFIHGAGATAAVAGGAAALRHSSALAVEPAGWDSESDILIVDSGYAGMCTAIEAAGAGCSVTMIEKSTVYGGNSILCAGNAQFGGGNSVQEAAGIDDNPERFYNEVLAYGKHRANPAQTPRCPTPLLTTPTNASIGSRITWALCSARA